jgi:hypothetical protein
MEVLLASYGMFRNNIKWLSKIKWEVVIFDEAHKLKSKGSEEKPKKTYAAACKVRAHVIRVRPPCATKKAPSECPKKNCASFWGPFLDIFPPLLFAAINSALSLWGVEGQKRCLGCMQRCTNMNSEKSQPTKCENYGLSKRSVSHLLQLFSPQKIFFVNFGSQIDKFNHFLTVFCHEIG